MGKKEKVSTMIEPRPLELAQRHRIAPFAIALQFRICSYEIHKNGSSLFTGMRVRVTLDFAHVFLDGFPLDKPEYIHISREISIEHPSVGLAQSLY